jgi:DNA-binding PadR family transcriptional regulator
MVYHAILGLLRDGRSRHGYDLIHEYRARSGRPVNPGNFYRECSKLVSQGLITPDANPPSADPRRIPYRITQAGRGDFDTWLTDARTLHTGLDNWMIFADMLPSSERMRLLDALRESLWMESKALASSREHAVSRVRRIDEGRRYQPGAFLLLRRIKQTTAELEFLLELRRTLEYASPAPFQVEAGSGGEKSAMAVRSIDDRKA